MGIDIGTSGCKAGVFTEEGRPLAQAYREYPTLHPAPGWAELDSRAVMGAVREVIAETVQATSADPVAALCVSAMGEAMTPVSEDRRILGNAILSADVRGAEYVEQLEAFLGQDAFYAINPNILAVNYSLPKLLWLRDHNTDLYEQAWKFLLWGDLAAFMLGGEAVTSCSHANRTLLFDLRREDWSEAILAWAGIRRDKLPRVAPSGAVVGRASGALSRELGLPADALIVLGGHDQCCSALGAGAIVGGKTVCGIGTIECLTPVFDRIPEASDMLNAGLSIEHHVLPDLYLTFIYNQSGALVKWFRDTFAQADQRLLRPDEDLYEALMAELPLEPTGLLALPHFEPTGAPHYIANSAGVIAGLHTDTPRGAILKALIEGASYYFLDSLRALTALGLGTSEYIASGGGAKSDALLQIKADIFGAPFVRLRHTECGIVGAAMLAGIASGAFANAREATERFVVQDRVFTPDPTRQGAYEKIYERYQRLYPALKDLLG